MNQTLRNRVRRLEALHSPEVQVVLILGVLGGYLARITSATAEWLRQPNEDAEQFRARVLALPHAATAGTLCVLSEHHTQTDPTTRPLALERSTA